MTVVRSKNMACSSRLVKSQGQENMTTLKLNASNSCVFLEGNLDSLKQSQTRGGLLALGCAADEYEDLTHKILGSKIRSETRSKVKQAILYELKNYFGEDIDSFEEGRKKEFHQALEKFLNEIHLLE